MIMPAHGKPVLQKAVWKGAIGAENLTVTSRRGIRQPNFLTITASNHDLSSAETLDKREHRTAMFPPAALGQPHLNNPAPAKFASPSARTQVLNSLAGGSCFG